MWGSHWKSHKRGILLLNHRQEQHLASPSSPQLSQVPICLHLQHHSSPGHLLGFWHLHLLFSPPPSLPPGVPLASVSPCVPSARVEEKRRRGLSPSSQRQRHTTNSRLDAPAPSPSIYSFTLSQPPFQFFHNHSTWAAAWLAAPASPAPLSPLVCVGLCGFTFHPQRTSQVRGEIRGLGSSQQAILGRTGSN